MGDRGEEGCQSRHFSRLIKSCFPNPNSTAINGGNPIVAKPKFAIGVSSLYSLPDDLLIEIFSRLPLSSLSSLSAVCRRFSRLLDSPSYYFRRRLHPTLFAFSLSPSFTLRVSSIRLLEDAFWNDAVFSSSAAIDADISHARLAALDRRVYIITRSSSAVFDPWTGSVRAGPGTLYPRKRFAAASVSGRIYVAGGSTRATAVEEYNPETDEWRVMSHASRKRYGCLGVGVDGIFYVIGGLKIGCASDPRAITSSEARNYASSMDLYDVATKTWLRSRAVPGGGCVVAACGAHGHVYILSSHAVELSFWRFNAGRKKPGFGEWNRMTGPPLPAQVRLDGSVRFSCIGLEDKVVLIQVMGYVRGYKEGTILIFDCVTEEWSRCPDLPEFLHRPFFICVNC